MSFLLRLTRRRRQPPSISGLQMLRTSSPPAAAQTAHGTKVTRFPLLRQLFAALLFDLGLCYSGRHFQRDRSARAMCCNGWRPSWAWVCINGNLSRVASWRPIGWHDPRFSWEEKPGSIHYGSLETLRRPPYDELEVSPRLRRFDHCSDRVPGLSLIDAHFSAGGMG